MRKLIKNKNKKGFAMAELLAVSIVLLFIFSILFSNYLPLVAEYETRLSYNDVTAQYAAHYIRKMYIEALEDTTVTGDMTKGKQLEETIKNGLKNYGYYTVYKKDSEGTINIINQQVDNSNGKVDKIINEYGIEEIIITTYRLNKKDSETNTTETKYVKKEYAKNGSLYKYINYLPNYENSIYTGNTQDGKSEQLYRLILKTKDFGYATTPIFSDYKTPGSCFKGIQNGNGLMITEYKYNGEECGKKVTIKNASITIKNARTEAPINGSINAIGDGVFEYTDSNSAYQVEEIILSNNVTSIGKNAFKGSNLKYINLDSVADKIENIGPYAFANTDMTEVDLSSYPSSSTIGEYAFANNENLTKVALPDYSIYSQGKTLSVGLFAKSGTAAGGIDVKIPNDMTDIGEEMFYLSKINSINLGNVQTIGKKAFSQSPDETTPTGNKIKNGGVEIPSSVTSIGESSFEMLGIASLSFKVGNDNSLEINSNDNSLVINSNAFKNNNISSLIIPSRVTSIGINAFENSGIASLTFDSIDSSRLDSIGDGAFKGNSFQNLRLPNSITRIGKQAFQGNSYLSSISLPSNVKYTEITFELFSNAKSLKSIEIPSNVTKIANSAFNTCNLEKVIFQGNSQLITIGGKAFGNNEDLEEFTIPKSVTAIGSDTFIGCENLKEITNYSDSDEVIEKLYSSGCSIFDKAKSCSSSISDDKKTITISYPNTAFSNVIITNTNVGGATNE
ncbi:MAG: leucine-rich repeat protein [Bacilli bacterium]